MLRSFKLKQQQPSIHCQQCTYKPEDQFVILLCDHVICADCIDTHNYGVVANSVEGFQCPCGVVTCFGSGRDRSQQRGSLEGVGHISARNKERKMGQVGDHLIGGKGLSTRASSRALQSRQSYPDVTRMKTEQFNTTNVYHHGENDPCKDTIEAQQQGNSSVLLERSRYPITSPQKLQTHLRNTSSTHRIHSTNKQSKHPINNESRQWHKQNHLPLTAQLQSEISYLETQFQHSIRTATRIFNKVVSQLTHSFEMFHSHLKDIYLETIVMNNRCDTQLDLAKIFKLQYQHTISSNINCFVTALSGVYEQVRAARAPRNSCPTNGVKSAIVTPKDYPRPIVSIYTKSSSPKIDDTHLCRHRKLKKKVSSKRRQFVIEI